MFFLLIPVILLYIIKRVFFPKKLKIIKDKHVVITGGSSGIGKSLAILAAKQGAHVTIIARDLQKLNSALSEIEEASISKDSKHSIISLDVCDYDSVHRELNAIEETVGPIYMLINCAGLAVCGKVEDIPLEDITKMVNINFLGSVYPTKVVIPKMKNRKNGIIVFVASQAALIGIFGYSIYSASKFALRGFAEALNMELQCHNVSVTVALPCDTNTPGYEIENKSKPIETALISTSGGLYDPNYVANVILQDALEGNFFSYFGFVGFMSSTLCAGLSKWNSYLQLLFQVFFMGLFRIIGSLYLGFYYRTVRKCLAKETKNK